jgi:hypothetical protein
MEGDLTFFEKWNTTLILKVKKMTSTLRQMEDDLRERKATALQPTKGVGGYKKNPYQTNCIFRDLEL